jgi:hypothetical protein
LTKEEGGRHTPFFNGYRPQFYFRTTDVTGVTTLSEGVEMVMPGDNVQMTATLIAPIAMEEGLRFAIAKAAALSAPVLYPRLSSNPVQIQLEAGYGLAPSPLFHHMTENFFTTGQ